MKFFKLLVAVVAGMTLTVATVNTAEASRTKHVRTTKQVRRNAKKRTAKKRVAVKKQVKRVKAKKQVKRPYNKPQAARPNYAYVLTQGRGHVINLTNTGRTENLYRVAVQEYQRTTSYYMALNPHQTWTIKKPRLFCVTVRRVSKADEKRNADPRNHYIPLGIRSTEKTLWSRQN